VVTADGPQVTTLFQCEELMVALSADVEASLLDDSERPTPAPPGAGRQVAHVVSCLRHGLTQSSEVKHEEAPPAHTRVP